MKIVLSTTQSLTVELAAAPAANQPHFLANYMDTADSAPASNPDALTGTTAVTAVAAPSTGARIVESLCVANLDTASVTVVVKIVGASTITIIQREIEAGKSRDVLQDEETAASSSGGTSDHGSLSGLTDDDHTQYHNDTRAAAWLAGLNPSAVEDNFVSFDGSGLPQDSGNSASSFDAAGTASSAITAHEGASDPHEQYLTAAEGDAAYDAAGAASTVNSALDAHLADAEDAHDASAISVDATPANYSPASADAEAHLAAIDSALGSISGGSGDMLRWRVWLGA